MGGLPRLGGRSLTDALSLRSLLRHTGIRLLRRRPVRGLWGLRGLREAVSGGRLRGGGVDTVALLPRVEP
ncbi:hypothetical protein TR66_37420, partial [Streptomyces sp. WM6391]